MTLWLGLIFWPIVAVLAVLFVHGAARPMPEPR